MSERNIWDEFDENIDTEGLQKDVEEAAESGGGEFKEVPEDAYEIEIEKIELKKAKQTGNPMLSVWMKIIEGEYKGQRMFYNQVMHTGYGVHLANEFLRSLGSEVDITFKSFTQYNGLLTEVKDDIVNLEYGVEYSKDAKGYSKYEITDIYEAESDV